MFSYRIPVTGVVDINEIYRTCCRLHPLPHNDSNGRVVTHMSKLISPTFVVYANRLFLLVQGSGWQLGPPVCAHRAHDVSSP